MGLPRLGRLLVALALTAGLGWGTAAAPAAATPPPNTPTARTAAGVATVGPLFFHGVRKPHGCTASVVASRGHNLLLTAAHCITGTGAGILFVPGYQAGHSPHGVWTVQKVWVDPSWVRSHDPRHDYAFLRVASQRIAGRQTDVEDVTGGNSLGITAHHSQHVRVTGYPGGLGDSPITCANLLLSTAGYPTFDCHAYSAGTSGSPFAAIGRDGRTWVTGLIGGLHQGGCYEWNSFSSPFTADIFVTYRRAESGRGADTTSSAGSDGC